MDKNTGSRQRRDGYWEAFGWVDAQNSFGAKLRSNWVVVASPDRTQIVYVKLGDDTRGSYPAEKQPAPKVPKGLPR